MDRTGQTIWESLSYLPEPERREEWRRLVYKPAYYAAYRAEKLEAAMEKLIGERTKAERQRENDRIKGLAWWKRLLKRF